MIFYFQIDVQLLPCVGKYFTLLQDPSPHSLVGGRGLEIRMTCRETIDSNKRIDPTQPRIPRSDLNWTVYLITTYPAM